MVPQPGIHQEARVPGLLPPGALPEAQLGTQTAAPSVPHSWSWGRRTPCVPAAGRRHPGPSTSAWPRSFSSTRTGLRRRRPARGRGCLPLRPTPDRTLLVGTEWSPHHPQAGCLPSQEAPAEGREARSRQDGAAMALYPPPQLGLPHGWGLPWRRRRWGLGLWVSVSPGLGGREKLRLNSLDCGTGAPCPSPGSPSSHRLSGLGASWHHPDGPSHPFPVAVKLKGRTLALCCSPSLWGQGRGRRGRSKGRRGSGRGPRCSGGGVRGGLRGGGLGGRAERCACAGEAAAGTRPEAPRQPRSPRSLPLAMSGVQRMKVANERHSKSITQRGGPHRAPVRAGR